MKSAFTARRLYTPIEEIQNPLLVVEDGLISEVSSRSMKEVPGNTSLIDFGDTVLAPGFVDIHMHGGAGLDAMRALPSELPRLGSFLTTHGVTGYFPTTVAAPLDATCAALGRLADAIEADAAATNGNSVQARPLGIHFEDRFSATSGEVCIRRKSGHAYGRNLRAPLAGGARACAHADYCSGNSWRDGSDCGGGAAQGLREHRALRRRDAHRADAVKAGARHATHTFNAMRPLDDRDPGIIGEVLSDDRMSADIIVDGIHVAPPIVKLFLRAKGRERAVLITDAISATGMPEGRYQLGPVEVDVKDGKCTSNGSLAGSVLTMDRAVRNVTQFSDWSLRDAVRAATLNPAQAVGLSGHHGILVQGLPRISTF